MKRKKTFLSILLALCLIGLNPMSLPCFDVVQNVEAASTVRLSKSSAILIKGQTLQLKVTGTKSKVKWYTSKSSIATVSQSGKVTAKKSGTAYITARVNGQKLKCKVSVRSNKSIIYKLHDAYDWQCEDIWNHGFCDTYHYIEDGTDSCGKKLDINKTISKLNKNYQKRNYYNKYVRSVQGKKYSNYKKTWEKLDKQTVYLKQILDKNGAPAPKSNYYFPYQKYADYLNDLMGYNFELSLNLI